MKPPAPTGAPPRFCPDCGDRIWNPGAHAERCVGKRAHGQCDCDPGFKHDPLCPEVVGYPEDAA